MLLADPECTAKGTVDGVSHHYPSYLSSVLYDLFKIQTVMTDSLSALFSQQSVLGQVTALYGTDTCRCKTMLAPTCLRGRVSKNS
jgi:hypothetical protein